MSEIARDDLVPLLRKYFGYRGQTNFELADFVIPVFDQRAEDPPFHQKRGGVTSAGITAGVAQYSTIGLQFPTGAPLDTRAVVRRLYIVENGGVATTFFAIAVVNAQLALTLAGQAGSWQGDGPLLQVGSRIPGVADALGNTALQIPAPLPNNGIVYCDKDWVIAPGQTLVVLNLNTNRNINVAAYWDEYNIG